MLENNEIVSEIREILNQTRNTITQTINYEMLMAYWNIGRIIVKNEQIGLSKASYGKQLLKTISKDLTNQLGKGFSVSNLQYMRRFYLNFQNQQTVSVKLSWSHYCEILNLTDINGRLFYIQEAINSKWSVRDLKRQINTSLYERLLLTNNSDNKTRVLELANKGIEVIQPKDILRDPYVFEFLNIPDNKPILEKDLEYALIRKIEHFLLELGRGFMFVGSQQRITISNNHYYVDLVFYHKILKAYILIDLKIGNLKPENIGQMNMYINYYAKEINEKDDEKPIGIILCANKSSIVAEYALGGLDNQIFVSKYTYFIPEKKELIHQLKLVLDEIDIP